MFLHCIEFKFDVLILSEVWTTNIEFLHNSFPGYDFYCDIPENSKVGRIGIFIKNSISHCIRADLKLDNVDSLEDLWLEANMGHSKYIIGGIYRHPNHSLDTC